MSRQMGRGGQSWRLVIAGYHYRLHPVHILGSFSLKDSAVWAIGARAAREIGHGVIFAARPDQTVPNAPSRELCSSSPPPPFEKPSVPSVSEYQIGYGIKREFRWGGGSAFYFGWECWLGSTNGPVIASFSASQLPLFSSYHTAFSGCDVFLPLFTFFILSFTSLHIIWPGFGIVDRMSNCL